MERGSDFETLLTELVRAGVDFIVIGGVAAVLHGVPMATYDLDVVHSRGRDCRKNLARVLRELETSYFRPPVEGVSPSEHDLASPLPHLLITRYGRLDLLGTAHAGLDYDDLLPRTTMVPLDTGVEVRVLDLRGLIEMKERVGRDKDKLHVLHLKRVLEERRKQRKEEA